MEKQQVEKIKQAVEVLRAIKHPFRRSIIDFIESKQQVSVTELIKKFYVSQSFMSQQLAILRNAGVVEFTRDSKFLLYSVNKKRLNEILKFCNNIFNE